MICNICGGTSFVPGFKGRLKNGEPPCCAGCGSVERHRIVYSLFEAIRPMIAGWRVLQFAPDPSVRKDWFRLHVGSTYGGANSMDVTATGLDDGAFDLVLANHVLEHVADEVAALGEMLRVVGPAGLVALTVPSPMSRWETVDWGFPDADKNGHYRTYGADCASRMVNAIGGLRALVAVARDPVTGTADHALFLSRDAELLARLARVWQRRSISLVNVFRA